MSQILTTSTASLLRGACSASVNRLVRTEDSKAVCARGAGVWLDLAPTLRIWSRPSRGAQAVVDVQSPADVVQVAGVE